MNGRILSLVYKNNAVYKCITLISISCYIESLYEKYVDRPDPYSAGKIGSVHRHMIQCNQIMQLISHIKVRSVNGKLIWLIIKPRSELSYMKRFEIRQFRRSSWYLIYNEVWMYVSCYIEILFILLLTGQNLLICSTYKALHVMQKKKN